MRERAGESLCRQSVSVALSVSAHKTGGTTEGLTATLENKKESANLSTCSSASELRTLATPSKQKEVANAAFASPLA